MSVKATLNICNTRGLHARASAKFVKLASSFESEIHVTRDGVTVDARSQIMLSEIQDLFGRPVWSRAS